jgi:hypothetical protein
LEATTIIDSMALGKTRVAADAIRSSLEVAAERRPAPSGARASLAAVGDDRACFTMRRTSVGPSRSPPLASSHAKISGRIPSAVTPTTSPSSRRDHRLERGELVGVHGDVLDPASRAPFAERSMMSSRERPGGSG